MTTQHFFRTIPAVPVRPTFNLPIATVITVFPLWVILQNNVLFSKDLKDKGNQYFLLIASMCFLLSLKLVLKMAIIFFVESCEKHVYQWSCVHLPSLIQKSFTSHCKRTIIYFLLSRCSKSK